MVQWGQPSFFSCLDLSYERGEASSDTQVEVTTLVSPTKNSHVRRKFKEWWIPVPSILTASVTSDQHQEPNGNSVSLPISLTHTSPLPLVPFHDDDTVDACFTCKPIQCVSPAPNLGGNFEVDAKRSKWLNRQYPCFNKQVGVSIAGFENQCLSLLVINYEGKQLCF
uniref:Uncharacterized protein n=1 Tax=Fagus sylvatica TaxID=28930 RepID=A0A2N9G8S8_FAGSY